MIEDYFRFLIKIAKKNPLVKKFRLIKEMTGVKKGYIRFVIELRDNSELHVSCKSVKSVSLYFSRHRLTPINTDFTSSRCQQNKCILEQYRKEPQMNTDERRYDYNNIINIFQGGASSLTHPPRPTEVL